MTQLKELHERDNLDDVISLELQLDNPDVLDKLSIIIGLYPAFDNSTTVWEPI